MPIKRIISGLNDFQQNYFKAHQDLFQRLSRGQTPEILFITCCDSRIAPNLLTQTEPGEIFIRPLAKKIYAIIPNFHFQTKSVNS
ncbi:Carbonic anhydrase [Planktothrix rubescens]|nr:Carbonic anhydrase [Planktothrix rubescens]